MSAGGHFGPLSLWGVGWRQRRQRVASGYGLAGADFARPGDRPRQRGQVIAGAVHDAVDEERRRAQHLTRCGAACNVAANALEHRFAAPVAVKARYFEAEL